MNYFSPAALGWLESLLQERFGHSLELKELNHTLSLSLPGTKGDILFDSLQPVFHQSRSDFPCQSWCSSGEGFKASIEDLIPAPATDSLPTRLIELHEQGATVHYDILGLTYWMLTRLEEIGRTDLDNHQRFPATSSHAFKHGYLERPIVDEWLIILGQVMQKVWPHIELKQHKFSMKVSHDVDDPTLYGFKTWYGLLRVMAGDVIKRRNLANAIRAPWIKLTTTQRLHPSDPANTFDWIMDISEQHGITSAFYFICGRTDPSKDADYEPEHPAIRDLMRRIHKRGHEIGLHPSYNTYQKPAALASEALRLRRIAAEEGIEQNEWGGRMHFLRWNQAITQKAWADAGMSYDSTLSYADRPGFRCGTCFEYPAFDTATDEPLELRIRPLVAMDCTVMAERYLGLGSTEAAYKKFNELKNNCRKVGGVFTLLWHNSFFSSPNDFDIYHRLVSEG